jgi:hypothetical protein
MTIRISPMPPQPEHRSQRCRDLVVCCDYRTASDHPSGRIKHGGAIDVPEIKREITAVMEGGRDTFWLRKSEVRVLRHRGVGTPATADHCVSWPVSVPGMPVASSWLASLAHPAIGNHWQIANSA